MKNSVQAKQYPKIPSRTFPMQNISAQYYILSLEHNYSISNILQVKIQKVFHNALDTTDIRELRLKQYLPHQTIPTSYCLYRELCL